MCGCKGYYCYIVYRLRDILIARGAPRTDGSGVRQRIFVALCVQGSFIISARLNTEKYITYPRQRKLEKELSSSKKSKATTMLGSV